MRRETWAWHWSWPRDTREGDPGLHICPAEQSWTRGWITRSLGQPHCWAGHWAAFLGGGGDPVAALVCLRPLICLPLPLSTALALPSGGSESGRSTPSLSMLSDSRPPSSTYQQAPRHFHIPGRPAPCLSRPGSPLSLLSPPPGCVCMVPDGGVPPAPHTRGARFLIPGHIGREHGAGYPWVALRLCLVPALASSLPLPCGWRAVPAGGAWVGLGLPSPWLCDSC